MNKFYTIYKLFTTALLSAAIFPFLLFTFLSGKYREHLNERFGCISSSIIKSFSGSPRIWLHAVSLGEIKVAKSVINALNEMIPGCAVILSTTTVHGRDLAIELLGNQIPVIFSPIDFFLSVKKILKRINPDILIFLETEIWPAWIFEAHIKKVKIALLNGRISKRSLRSYLKLKPFLKIILENIDSFSMISPTDRDRMISIGAEPEKIIVNGNAKYDSLIEQTDPEIEKELRNKLNIDPSLPVFIAGSTRTGEEEIILKAYSIILEKYPETILIIAPRHLERITEISSVLFKDHIGFHLKSELNDTQKRRKYNVLLIDTYGELFNLYSIGTMAFCGASLVPLGGQNPFEPAAWGVPVLHGPHMEDFLDAKAMLEKFEGSIEVMGYEDMAEKALELLNRPDLLKSKGESAKKALLKNKNAAKKHASVIAGLLSKTY